MSHNFCAIANASQLQIRCFRPILREFHRYLLEKIMPNLKIVVSVIALAAQIFAPFSYSDENSVENTTEELEVVVVWGTKVSSELLNLSEEDISLRQADHLSDLLRIVPGVDIGGTHSVNTRVNIRGLDDRELDIYIDGALQTNYLYHHIGNLLINPDVLRTAEIQVGANSIIDGGIGGSVRLETKSARDFIDTSKRGYGGRLVTSYNNNAKQGVSLTGFSQITDNLDAIAYFQNEDRSNFTDGSQRTTIGSDGTTQNLLFKFGYSPTENHRLEFSFDKLDDGGDYTPRPDMGAITNRIRTGNTLLPTEYERQTSNLSYEFNLGEFFLVEATYYTNDLRLRRDETNTRYTTSRGNTLKQAASDNQGLNVLLSTLLSGKQTHDLTYGFKFFDQELNFVRDIRAEDGAIVQNAETLAFFIEDDISISKNFRIRPGVRYSQYKVDYESSGASDSWDKLTFGIASEYSWNESLQFKASHTQLFQGPELAEPFVGAGGNKISNPDLKPEDGYNTEVGLRFLNDFGNKSVGFGLTIFNTIIDGYIGEVAVPETTTNETHDVNLGIIKIQGFEATFTSIIHDFTIFLSHTASDFDTSQLKGTRVSESIRETGDSITYEIGYEWSDRNFYTAVTGQYVQSTTTSIGHYKAGYTVHHVSSRWENPFNVKNAVFSIGIDNLFDKTYTSHASRIGTGTYPSYGIIAVDDIEPGRNIKVSIALSF